MLRRARPSDLGEDVDMDRRTAVLLGAGASVDAGLPLTFHLAELIVKKVNDSARGTLPGAVRALNFAYGSMVGFQADDGGNPLGAVNIERLISALRLLQDAKNHEVAPFVANWKGGALGSGQLTGRDGALLAGAVSKAMGGQAGFAGRDIEKAVAQIAGVSSPIPGGRMFIEAESLILENLSGMLSEISTVDYLAPISDLAREQAGGLDVITLNYDLTIEQMAASKRIPVHRGIDNWQAGRPLSFPGGDGAINLYKIHGSLDWTFEPPGDEVEAPSIKVGVASGQSWNARPWIVVGDREKLATEGPTLELLRAAEEAIQRATDLLVVGYSFGDEHVNRMIRNWMLGSPDRNLGLLDTAVANYGNFWATQPFPSRLIRRYGASPENQWASRVHTYAGTTAELLGDAVRMMPSPTPDHLFRTEILDRDGEVARIRLVLDGPDLADIHCSAFAEQTAATGPGMGTPLGISIERDAVVSDLPPSAPRGPTPVLRLSIMRTGDSIEAFLPVEDHSILQISARRLDSVYQTTALLRPFDEIDPKL